MQRLLRASVQQGRFSYDGRARTAGGTLQARKSPETRVQALPLPRGKLKLSVSRHVYRMHPTSINTPTV